jgi:hypothetical protein
MLARFAVVASLAAMGLIGGAALVSAHDQAYDTRITIHEVDEGLNYRGRVISKLHACERNRTIKFKRRRAGPDELINTIQSDDEGKWRFGFVGERYYVVAVHVVVGGSGHHHACRRDRSPTA